MPRTAPEGPNRRRTTARELAARVLLILTVLLVSTTGYVLAGAQTAAHSNGSPGFVLPHPAALSLGKSYIAKSPASTGETKLSVTLGAVSAYGTLVAFVAATSALTSLTVQAPKDTFTQKAAFSSEGYAYVASNITAASGPTVYANVSLSVSGWALIVYIINGATTVATDVVSSSLASGTTGTAAATITTTVANDEGFLLAYGFGTTTTEKTSASGDTQGASTNATLSGGTSYFYAGSFYEALATAGSNTMSATLSTAEQWYALALAIKPASVPATPTSFTHGTITTTTIALTWHNGPGPIVNVTIGRATYSGSCGSYTTIESSGSKIATYTATGLSVATSYCFRLGVWNATGESTRVVLSDVTTNAALAASFTWAPTTPDAAESATFTSTVTGGNPGYTYAWKFGDGGGTSTAANPTHSFAGAGTWWVYLNVTDTTPTTVEVSHQVTVNAGLSVTFSVSPTSPERGKTATFTSTVTGGTAAFTYAWVFGGGGGTSTAADPTHSFSTVGTWHVELNVTDANGVTAEHTATVVVTRPPAPTGLHGYGSSQYGQSILWKWTLPTAFGATFTIAFLVTDGSCSIHPGQNLSVGNVSEYLEPALTSGSYCAQVAACASPLTAVGCSYLSASFTVSIPTAPAAPTYVNGHANETEILWNWTLPKKDTFDNVSITVGPRPPHSISCDYGPSLSLGVVSQYLNVSLEPATVYCAIVTTWNGTASTSADVVIVSTLFVQKPSAPTDLVGHPNSTAIIWTWALPDPSNTTNVTLAYGTSCPTRFSYFDPGLTSVNIAKGVSAGATEEYDVVGLAPSTKYCATVVAWDGETASGTMIHPFFENATTLASSKPAVAPAKPTALTGIGNVSAIALYWTPPHGGTFTHETLGLGTTCATLTTRQVGQSAFYVWGALSAATTYCVRVAAYNFSASSHGDYANVSTGHGSPILDANEVNTTSVEFVWLLPPGTIVNLTLKWGMSPTTETHHISLSPSLTHYSLNGLPSNFTIYASLLAWTSAGSGPASNPVTATTRVPVTGGHVVAAATPFPYTAVILLFVAGIGISVALSVWHDRRARKPIERAVGRGIQAPSTSRPPPPPRRPPARFG